jgi:virion morphogenesis protein
MICCSFAMDGQSDAQPNGNAGFNANQGKSMLSRMAQIAVEKAQATHPDIARIAIKTMMANQKFKNALTPESLAWVRELLRG